jgi:transcriptional regulator with XRE-family HTH domain
MRRGTPAAISFGRLLLALRTNRGMTTQEVADKIGGFRATVSQAEKGERAVKEPKLFVWANALGVEEAYLRMAWVDCQSEEDPPITRNRKKAIKHKELETLLSELNGLERERVRGYVEAIIENRWNDGTTTDDCAFLV